jgi:tricorn protease-like protein
MKQKKTESRALEQTQLQIALDSAEKEVAMFQGVSAISQLPNLSKYASEIVLGSEEHCVALSKNARHIVSRKRTKIVGRTAGVSYKVSKNMRVRLGGFQGEPRTTIHDEEADAGTVYVTDQRFIFGGAKEVVTVPIAKIAKVAVEGDDDIVQVLIENREEPLTVRITEQFRGPVIAAAAERMVRERLDHKLAGKGG